MTHQLHGNHMLCYWGQMGKVYIPYVLYIYHAETHCASLHARCCCMHKMSTPPCMIVFQLEQKRWCFVLWFSPPPVCYINDIECVVWCHICHHIGNDYEFTKLHSSACLAAWQNTTCTVTEVICFVKCKNANTLSLKSILYDIWGKMILEKLVHSGNVLVEFKIDSVQWNTRWRDEWVRLWKGTSVFLHFVWELWSLEPKHDPDIQTRLPALKHSASHPLTI